MQLRSVADCDTLLVVAVVLNTGCGSQDGCAFAAHLQGIRYVEKHRGELQLPIYVVHGTKDAVTDISVSSQHP
jgi:hypothetical protein